MESMRDVDRVMEREIKKESTPLKFEQLGLEITAAMRLHRRKSFYRCFPICCGLGSMKHSPGKP